tara:strand:- start:4218 stop:5525 length:1308 start_codon:yes stop_codon:yes gene_type:complete
MNKKLFCVLEQSSYPNFDLSIYHKKIFTTEFCDYYRLNWKTEDKISDFFHPNITKSEGLSLLYEKCPKNYEYYMFIDDDILFKSGQKITINNISYYDPALIIKNFINNYKPLIGTFDGPHTNCRIVNKLKDNNKYFKKYNTYCWMESDFDAVIFHKSFIGKILPIMYHSSTKYFKPFYYICHSLHPNKMIRCCEINYENTRHVFTSSHYNKYSFIQSGLFILLKNFSLINQKYKSNLFNLIFDKNNALQKHLSLSFINIPSKDSVEFKLEDLDKIININHSDYLKRKSISIYNNFNEKNKNKLLSNEQDYILIHSPSESSNLYFLILEYIYENNINNYVVETSPLSNKRLLNNVINVIDNNFNIKIICNIDNNSLKNKNWFLELFKIFNIKPIEFETIKNLINTNHIKIYKHKNLSIHFTGFNSLNQKNISKILY